MGLNRYFAPQLPSAGTFLLSPEETHHAIRVRREAVGNGCIVFDGRGHQASCRVVHASARSIELAVETFEFAPNELPGEVILAVAMPKGDRQKAIIEKAVELGVHELVPILCRRSVFLPDESHIDKWNRTAIEASKQSERNRLIRIRTPLSFASLVDGESSPSEFADPSTLRMFAHPKTHGIPQPALTSSIDDPAGPVFSRSIVAIGPEGGFTLDEVEYASRAAWRQLDLGPRILRVETAVCAASFYANMRTK